MGNIEILAPAGSLESLYGALDMGADAVYVGTKRFGARAFAKNPDVEELQEALTYAHLRGKRIYLTVNTLLKDWELERELFPMVRPLYENGLDACIVQDMGVLSFLHENFPDMPLHASTQMTLFSGEEAELLRPFGVTRYVPARELSIEEIREARGQTDLEIEVFVHGALCYCYSGQCLMSQVIGGRSGNRGMCAQPCRLRFQSPAGDGYLFSTKDICTLMDIPELVDAGIDSFKIEGRMKNKEYSGYVAYLYRKYTTLYQEEGRKFFQELRQDRDSSLWRDFRRCQDLYNRGGFSRGFLFEKEKGRVMYPKKNNHRGTLAGEVVKTDGQRAGFTVREELSYQDVLEFRGEDGMSCYEYTVKNGALPGDYVETNVLRGSHIYPGQKVYRTRSESLYQMIREKMEGAKQRYPLRGKFTATQGEPAIFEVTGNNVSVVIQGPLVQKAGNRPVTEEKIREKLDALGNTGYYFEELQIHIEEDSFIPLGSLKTLRRQGILEWEQAAVKKRRLRTATLQESQSDSCSAQLDRYVVEKLLSVANLDQLKTALEAVQGEVVFHLKLGDIPPDDWGQAVRCLEGKKMAVSFPRVLRGPGRRAFEKEWEKYGGVFTKEAVDFVVVNSHAMFLYADKFWPAAVKIAAKNLYQENDRARQAYESLGIYPSLPCVYGRVPVMVSESCVMKTLSLCKKDIADPGKGGEKRLPVKTPKGDEFVVVNHCRYCYNTVYTKEPVREGVTEGAMWIDFTWEQEKEVREVIRRWNF